MGSFPETYNDPQKLTQLSLVDCADSFAMVMPKAKGSDSSVVASS